MKRSLIAALYGLLFASASVHAQAALNDAAVYRGLGESQGIAAIVTVFIPIAKSDPRIAATFEDTDLVQFGKRLAELICEVSGGPCRYTGKYKDKDMATVHQDMKISNAMFNALVEDLQMAMDERKVPFATQNMLLSKLAPMQRQIVTR